MCNYRENFAAQDGGAIHLTDDSTGVIEICHFMSNRAVQGGALQADDVKFLSIRGTLLLKNVALSVGGTITIGAATNVTINNIRCVQNHAGQGVCLSIDSVKLTLENSEISENLRQYDASVTATNLRIQVSLGIFSLTLFTLLNFISLGACGST